jgi:hypothetical protein
MSNVSKHLLAVASQEEHEENAAAGGPVVDAPQETWVDLPETDMNGVQEGLDTQEALNQLADRVEASGDDQASLESFNWTYKTLTRLTGLAPKVYPSLEDFNGDAPLQRSVLAKSIRKHSDRLGRAITLSIEDYTDTFGTTLQKLLESMQSSAKDLDRALDRINNVPGKKARVDHSRIWAMLHVDGRFMKDLDTGLVAEERSLKDLIALAAKAAKHVASEGGADEVISTINGGSKQKLMFNTTVTFSGGKADFNKVSPPSPKTEKIGADYLRGAAWGAVIGFFIFGMVIPGAIIGTFGSSATGNTATSKRDLEKTKHTLRAIGAFADLSRSIEEVANELDEAVKGAEDADRANVKRAAAPVMELLGAVTRHVAELAYGGMTMASALASAE